MSTTTIRLPDDLKARVAAAAEHAGTTSHNFILQAIAEKTAQQEQRSAFNELADSRYVKILATGKTIPWSQMRHFLEAQLGEQTASVRPVARKLVR